MDDGLAEAVEALINAGSDENRIRRVLEERQALLLSSATFDRMRALIDKQSRAGNHELAANIRRHLNLLEDARASSIAAAVQRYTLAQQREEKAQRETFHALLALTDPKRTSTETRLLLQERRDVLLSETAITLLRQRIGISRASRDDKSVMYLDRYLLLLQEGFRRGVDAAWQRFSLRVDEEASGRITEIATRLVTDGELRASIKNLRPPISSAPELLLNVLDVDAEIYRRWLEVGLTLTAFTMKVAQAGPKAARQFLAKEQDILLSNTAQSMVRMFMTLYQLEHEREKAERFAQTLRELESARKRG